MNTREFVDIIQKSVVEAAATDTISIVQRPPGRRPAEELVELSNWFNTLPKADQKMVERIAAKASRSAIFGLFSVIDGSRSIETTMGARGHFELRYVKGDEHVTLAGPHGDPLHELLE
jgi:hypothetical protein